MLNSALLLLLGLLRRIGGTPPTDTGQASRYTQYCYISKPFKKKKYSNYELKLALIFWDENLAIFLISAALP